MPEETTWAYSPSRWGEIFHNVVNPDGSQIDEILGAGAAGPGKSMVLLADPLQQIAVEHERCIDKEHPFHQPMGQSTGWGLHLRRESTMLGETIARSHRMFPAIDPGARFVTKDNTWIFSSGYRLQFGHCKDPNDWEKYYSSQYTWIGFDELNQFDKEQYTHITGRLRSADPVLSKMLKVRSCSNPTLKRENNEKIVLTGDPHWVRKYFVQPHRKGRKIIKRKLTMGDGSTEWHTRLYLPATLYDNPDPAFVRSFEKTLRAMPLHMQQALIYGNWWVTQDSFYADDWREQLHTCPPFKIPDNWKRFRSMDWGFKSPGCVLWFAMDEDENLWVEREFTFRKMTDIEVAKRILEIETDLGLIRAGRSVLSGPADDQLWERRGSSAKSMAEVMAEMGVNWTRADKRSRRNNAQKLIARLKDHDHGTTTPGIVFFDTCHQCITTLPGIQTDLRDMETPMDGGDDHWHDATLYGVAFASHGRLGIPSHRSEDDWMDEDEPEALDDDRGQWGYGAI